MSRVGEWLKEHWYYVAGGVVAIIVFLYIVRQSSSSGGTSAVALPAGGTPGTGGQVGSQGSLNLTSGDLSNLPPNLLPPTCPNGQVPEPTMVSGGAGMPSFLLGWKCVDSPVPTPTPGPINKGPCIEVDCMMGWSRITNPITGCPMCVPPVPSPVPPVPAPAPIPVPAATPPPAPTPSPRSQVVCSWPSWCGSLWGIAQHFYGNGALWPQIYNANKGLIGSNPNLIHPGQNLVIP